MNTVHKSSLKEFIKPQLKRAKELGLDFITDIQISPSRTHKYQVILNNGKKINYGSYGMDDYLMHKDENRRIRFHHRFHNNKGYNNPNSGLFYSARLLW